MKQTEKDFGLFLKKIEDFSLPDERGRWNVEDTNNMTGHIIGALEFGASTQGIIASLSIFETKTGQRMNTTPVLDGLNRELERRGELENDNSELFKLQESLIRRSVLPSGLAVKANFSAHEPHENYEKTLFDIEHSSMNTRTRGESQQTEFDRDRLAMEIVSALETGASHDDVLSAVLRLKLRNPDIQFTTENGRDFTDVLQSLAAERENIPSNASLSAEFIDGLRDAANAPANGSMTQRAFIDSSSKSVPMSGGIIQSLSPETYAGIHHATANLKMGILTTLSGGKAEALGFDPDRYTMAGRASELENDGMA